jgi:hypothetical protein
VVHGSHKEHKECVDRIYFGFEDQKRLHETSLFKECKETGARCEKLSARIRTLCKDLVQGVHRSEIQLSLKGTFQEVEEP